MSADGQLPRFWFGAPPQLLAGEQWVAHHAANRSQGKRAVGGGLHFTTHRALFCPNLLDASMGGHPWSCTLAEIATAGIEPGRFAFSELFSGGLRDRLRIGLNDGRCELFVIASPERVAAELRALLASRTG